MVGAEQPSGRSDLLELAELPLSFPGETVGLKSGDCALGFYAAIEVKCAGDFAKIYFLSNGADLVLATLLGFSADSVPLREGDGIILGLQLRPPGWSPRVTFR